TKLFFPRMGTIPIRLHCSSETDIHLPPKCQFELAGSRPSSPPKKREPATFLPLSQCTFPVRLAGRERFRVRSVLASEPCTTDGETSCPASACPPGQTAATWPRACAARSCGYAPPPCPAPPTR